MKIAEKTIPFSTDNTYQASFLKAIGGELLGIDRANPSRLVYVFALTLEQTEAASQYSLHKASVDPLDMAMSHKDLMVEIKNPKREGDDNG